VTEIKGWFLPAEIMISLLAWTLASIPYLEIYIRGLYFSTHCCFCMTKIKNTKGTTIPGVHNTSGPTILY
jgi:hypothetical protein